MGNVRCVRMEKLPVPYDVAWSAPLIVETSSGRLQVRRHSWTDAAARAQLYTEADACVFSAGAADLGLLALELAAAAVPIAAIAADLPFELRDERCAGLLPGGPAFVGALRDRIAVWSRDSAAARRTGQRAALASAGRSWVPTLDHLHERLTTLVA
jgi:hypothetical protein